VTSDPAPKQCPSSFAYVDCDIPIGMTIHEYRRQRCAPRRVWSRRLRMLLRAPFVFLSSLLW
jgi:hypothetical protein